MKFSASVIATLLTAIIKLISPEMLRAWLTSALDKLEQIVRDSPNEYDDAIIPLLAAIRSMLGGQ